jgi:hypothetical protein
MADLLRAECLGVGGEAEKGVDFLLARVPGVAEPKM